jgi:hypothetical protein
VEQPEPDRAGEQREQPPQRRAHDALERLLVVWIALDRGVEPRMVERERDADEPGPPLDEALQLEREAPAPRVVRLEQRVGVGEAERLDA